MIVVYHSSDLYAPVLGTSILSLFENNKNIEVITVYIIENKISELNKKKLNNLASNFNREIVFIKMPDVNRIQNLGLKNVKSVWIFDSYIRLFLSEVLPDNIERVLYLDSDVIINGSLKELWEIDLEDNVVAGVMDCLSEEYYKVFGILKNNFYFNSGVLLFDLVKWRLNKMGDRIREYIKINDGYVFFMEQTTLSAVAQGKVLLLNPKYNVLTLPSLLSYKQLYILRKMDRYYDREQIESALETPVMLHFTNCFLVNNRPWVKGSNHPLRCYFEKYFLLTEWGEQGLFEDRRTFKKKVLDKVISILPLNICLSIASYLYNVIRIKQIKNSRVSY